MRSDACNIFSHRNTEKPNKAWKHVAAWASGGEKGYLPTPILRVFTKSSFKKMNGFDIFRILYFRPK